MDPVSARPDALDGTTPTQDGGRVGASAASGMSARDRRLAQGVGGAAAPQVRPRAQLPRLGQVPVYIAEISPQNMRGALGSVNQLSVTIGIVLAYILGMFVPWRMLAVIGILPCTILIPGLFFIPESPRWLAKMNKMEDFETSLQVLRGFETDITSEVNDIKTRARQCLAECSCELDKDCCHHSNRG